MPDKNLESNKKNYDKRLEDDDMESMLESCGGNSFFTLVRYKFKSQILARQKILLYYFSGKI